MIAHALFLSAVMSLISAPAPSSLPDATVLAPPVGGPPSIRLAGKAKGDITKAEWTALRSVDLVGCVPDAHITALTVCIKDCTGKDAAQKTNNGVITQEMRTMVLNLPAGTAFTVKVEVKDAKGKAWDVLPAHYVWKA
jgi:hypothetical protein